MKLSVLTFFHYVHMILMQCHCGSFEIGQFAKTLLIPRTSSSQNCKFCIIDQLEFNYCLLGDLEQDKCFHVMGLYELPRKIGTEAVHIDNDCESCSFILSNLLTDVYIVPELLSIILN